MRALIYELAGNIGVGALDLAGRPLVVRQLQWLRDLGIEDVVVELSSGHADVARADVLVGTDPLVSKVVVLPTPRPLGVEALCDRAGFDDGELFLALPADLAARTRLELPSRPRRYLLAPPIPSDDARSAELVFRTRASLPSGDAATIAGWGLAVRAEARAHALSCAALSGQAEGMLVHGAEVRPGIWYARGARVAEDATLTAPVLIGAGARVFEGARLGPNVVLGPGAVVEREAVLSEVSVAGDTLIGEGARIRQAYVDVRGMVSLVDGTRTAVHDPLLLAPASAPRTEADARFVALALALVLLAPWLVACAIVLPFGRRPLRRVAWGDDTLHVGALGIAALDLVPALYDVLRGTRDLVGIARASLLLDAVRDAPAQRAGALDVTPALAPSASPPSLRCMWRWYLLNKRPDLDRTLLLESLRKRDA